MAEKDGGPAFAVGMGMDAFRICIGMAPRNHPADEVARWFNLMLTARERD